MSPQNDTPEHNDEPTPETVIAQGLAAAMTDDAPNYYSWLASKAVEALKEAGFEITKRSELGVTKGLPGIAAEAGIRALKQLTAGMKFPPPPEPDRVLAYPTWGLEHLAPGAAQAAQTGFDLVKRHVAFVGQNIDIPLAAALDLIGRRTDIVAVQLPEPKDGDGDCWYGPGQWLVHTGMGGESVCAESLHTDLFEFAPDAAREFAANLLAAASRADAANVADAAEDGGK